MFRSSGVGYMKLGDINTSIGNQFLSSTSAARFAMRCGDSAAQPGSAHRCHGTVSLVSGNGCGKPTSSDVGELSVGVETVGVRNSKRDAVQVHRNRLNVPKFEDDETRSLPNSGNDAFKGKYSPRNFRKYTPKKQEDEAMSTMETKHYLSQAEEQRLLALALPPALIL